MVGETNFVLNLDLNSLRNHAKVNVWIHNGHDTQQWVFTAGGIRSGTSQKYGNSESQKWTFQRSP